MHEEEILGKAYDGRLMRRLIQYLRPHRKFVAIAFVLIVFESALETIFPWLTKIAIDEHIARSDVRGLGLIAVAYVFVLFVTFVAALAQPVILKNAGEKMMSDMRTQIFTHLQTLSPSFYDRNPVGRLITRVTTDVDVLNELFSAGIVSIFGDVFTLTGILIAIMILDWKLALVTMYVEALIG